MADIKYLLKFGKREHLESLVSGNIYCSNAITFWGIEDKLKIKGQGDILEAGTRMFAQKMIMQHPDTKEVIAKCVSGCNLGLDVAIWDSGLDVRHFGMLLGK